MRYAIYCATCLTIAFASIAIYGMHARHNYRKALGK